MDKNNLDLNSYIEFGNQYDGKGALTTIPLYAENIDNRFGGFIKWGKNNLYPSTLLALAAKSPMHNSIIGLKSSMIGGNGFIDADYDQLMVQFLKNQPVGSYNNDKLSEILYKNACDLVIFGGFAVNVRWNKGKNSIAEINYISPATIRIKYSQEEIDNETYEESYLVSPDWSNANKACNYPQQFKKFDVNNKEDSQILFYRMHRADNGCYPLPDYNAGMEVIETDVEINAFHLSSIRNQFAPSMVLTFPFTPKSVEEKKDLVRKTALNFKGSMKAGEPMIFFGKDKDNLPSVAPINLGDGDKRFETLKKSVIENIVIAHKLTNQSLLGIDQNQNALGSRNNLLESLSTFQATYVCGYQRVIENVYNLLAKQNGITQKIVIEKYSTNLTPDIPISDMISLLSSTLSEKQKCGILENKGYTREEALKLVNPGDVAPVVAPTSNLSEQRYSKTSDEKRFISNCIEKVMNDGTANDIDQAISICYLEWDK